MPPRRTTPRWPAPLSGSSAWSHPLGRSWAPASPFACCEELSAQRRTPMPRATRTPPGPLVDELDDGGRPARSTPATRRVTNPCHARPRPARRWLGRGSMVGRCHRSSRSRSRSTAQSLSASLDSGARCRVTSYRPRRRGLILGRLRRSLPPERRGSAFSCIDSSSVRPRLFFQRVPEGKVVKNRVHLACGLARGWSVTSGWRRLRPSARGWSALGAVRQRLLGGDGVEESSIRRAGRRGRRVLSRLVAAGAEELASDVPSHRTWPASTPLTCGGPDSLRRRPAG